MPSSAATLGFRHQIGRIAPVIVFFGVDPYSESNRIQAQILHQLETIGLHTGGIVKFHTLMFHLRYPTDVGTFSKVCSQRFLLIGKSTSIGVCLIIAAACKYCKGNTKKEVKNFMCFMALSSLIAYCKYKHLGNIELYITLICQNTGICNRLHKLTTR